MAGCAICGDVSIRGIRQYQATMWANTILLFMCEEHLYMSREDLRKFMNKKLPEQDKAMIDQNKR